MGQPEYIDLAVIDLAASGARVLQRCEGLFFEALQALTAVPLPPPDGPMAASCAD